MQSDLDRYVTLLEAFYLPDEVELWLTLPQPALGGACPCDLIRDGREQEVLEVIARLTDSVYV